LLAHLGFEALATTSADHAFSIGQRDSTINRDGVMAHVSAIAAATDLPVSAVLENRFGGTPEIVAETIGCGRLLRERLAARLKTHPGAPMVFPVLSAMPSSESAPPRRWFVPSRFLGQVSLRVLLLRTIPFETAILERYWGARVRLKRP
jgi:hypothetical protein